jgi:2Fe-2S ferredoxin
VIPAASRRRRLAAAEIFTYNRPGDFPARAAGGLTPGLLAASQQPDGITMPNITYIDHSGREYKVVGDVGQTVMETAIKHDVPGIVAECGGACSCATCHVYVDPAWRATTGEPSQMEEDMLDFAFDVRPESRLSCQLRITDAFDGLVVRVPEHQG